MKTKALALDLDGVLVASRGWHERAFLEALAERGVVIGADYHARFLDALSTEQKLEALVQQGKIRDENLAGINARKQEITRELIARYCRPDSRLHELIATLHALPLRMCVCTNAIRSTLDLILGKLEVAEFFEFTLANDSVSRRKPHPEIYSRAAALFKVAPEEMLVVEDSQIGFASARGAGCRVLLIPGPEYLLLETLREYL